MQARLDVVFNDQSPQADIAVQVWLADLALFAQQHNEQRLERLSAFETFGSNAPVDRQQTFTLPDAGTLTRIRRRGMSALRARLRPEDRDLRQPDI